MICADFVCDICGKIVEDSISNHPMCCEQKMRKKFSLGGISFKGAGFYVTDYKQESKGNDAKESAE